MTAKTRSKTKRGAAPAPSLQPPITHVHFVRPPKRRNQAVGLVLALVAIIAVSVVGAMRYSNELSKINWQIVALLCGVGLVVLAVYRWQITNKNYDWVDLVTTDGKADLGKHLTILSFFLAVWVVVQQALAKEPVTELVLGVLGFFVAEKALRGFSSALGNRPPATDKSTDINVLPNANVVSAPAAPNRPLGE